MSGNIIQLNEQFIHNELKTIVKNSGSLYNEIAHLKN